MTCDGLSSSLTLVASDNKEFGILPRVEVEQSLGPLECSDVSNENTRMEQSNGISTADLYLFKWD